MSPAELRSPPAATAAVRASPSVRQRRHLPRRSPAQRSSRNSSTAGCRVCHSVSRTEQMRRARTQRLDDREPHRREPWAGPGAAATQRSRSRSGDAMINGDAMPTIRSSRDTNTASDVTAAPPSFSPDGAQIRSSIQFTSLAMPFTSAISARSPSSRTGRQSCRSTGVMLEIGCGKGDTWGLHARRRNTGSTSPRR